jgi:hypothetical protein
MLTTYAATCHSEVSITNGDNTDALLECCSPSDWLSNFWGCDASRAGNINSWSLYSWGFFEGSKLKTKAERIKEEAEQAKGWSPDIGGFRVNRDGTVSVRFVMSQEDVDTFKQPFIANGNVRVPFAFEIDVVDDKTNNKKDPNSIFGTTQRKDYTVKINPPIQGEDLDSKFVVPDEGAYDEKKTLSALIARPDLLDAWKIYEVVFIPDSKPRKGKETELHMTFQVSVNYKYISALRNGSSEKCDYIRFVGEASERRNSDHSGWGFGIPININDVPTDNSLPEGAINGWYYYGTSLPDAWKSKKVKVGHEKSSTYCFDDTVVKSHDKFARKKYCKDLFENNPGDSYMGKKPPRDGTGNGDDYGNDDIDDVSVAPETGSWTSSPQHLSVSSDGAERIYYTMVNTYDGSTPPDPDTPSPSSSNGYISGSSGTFDLYATSGQYKRSKLRFVGCNSGGCGSASPVFSYAINLSGGNGGGNAPGGAVVSPAVGSWTSSPQWINVRADNAERIYCTLRTTLDGSEPETPPEPTIESHDPCAQGVDYIGGSSGQFQFYAENGQNKRLKVRFRGYNGKGYGPTSGSFLYHINLNDGGGGGGTPDSVSVSPAGGDWTDTPHEVSVSSSGADRVYCTVRTTLDGSIPEEPPEPTVESHDLFDMGVDYLSGSSGTFKVWGATGYKKFVKVRFRGYKDGVYGTSSNSYLYSIDLKGVEPPRSITVTNPTPGEEWDSDRSHHIRWETDNIGSDQHVMVRYSPDDGGTWYTIADSTPNDGSKEWDMPHDARLCSHRDTDTARIKIISVEHPETFTVSERFKIDYKKGHPDCD